MLGVKAENMLTSCYFFVGSGLSCAADCRVLFSILLPLRLAMLHGNTFYSLSSTLILILRELIIYFHYLRSDSN